MKVLLIQPNSTDEVNKEFVSLQYPLNLGYIAAVLREKGHEVRMVDFNVIDSKKLPLLISGYKPELVGVTAMTPSIHNAKGIISEIKSLDKGIITVLGGVFASALPKTTMEEIEDLDYLIFGEGEITIVELIEHILKKKDLSSVDGLVFRKGKRIVKNKPLELIKNLDTIPFPVRDLVPIGLYAMHHVSRGFSRKEMKIIELMTSRGCPNQCIFCASGVIYGHKVRFRSYENITDEILECIKRDSINHVSILDDTFTINKNLVKRLCGFFNDQNLTWDCFARVDTVNYDLLNLMAKSGCKKVSFGVESGSPEILKKIKKGITPIQVIKAVKDAKKAGIRYIECTFMIGSHIDETVDDVEATSKLIYKLMPDILGVCIMCPYPGTEIYQMMINHNYLDKNPNWSQFSFYGHLNRYKRITHLTSEQMSKLQYDIIKNYYSSPKYVFSQLIQIRTFKEIKYITRMAKVFLREIVFK